MATIPWSEGPHHKRSAAFLTKRLVETRSASEDQPSFSSRGGSGLYSVPSSSNDLPAVRTNLSG